MDGIELTAKTEKSTKERWVYTNVVYSRSRTLARIVQYRLLPSTSKTCVLLFLDGSTISHESPMDDTHTLDTFFFFTFSLSPLFLVHFILRGFYDDTSARNLMLL
jgi:hypothetical protein